MNKTVNESLTDELKRYKEQIKIFEDRQKVDLNDKEQYINSQLRDVIIDRNAKVVDFQNQIHSLKLQLSATVESHKTLSTTVDVLKKDLKQKRINISKTSLTHKTALGYQNHLYLNQVKQKVPSLYCGNIIVKQHDVLSITDSKETLILAEESRLKMHAKQNDPIAKEKKVNIAPKLFISQDLVHTAMNSLAEIVDYQSMEKSYLDEYSKCVHLKVELLKKNDMVEKAVYNELSKRCAGIENRCKSVYECDKSENISKVIALGLYKLDLEPLSPKLMQNRKAHVDYLKHTAGTLLEIVEQARALNPLDSDLDFACKFVTRIHELLVYVSATCPSASKQSEKLIEGNSKKQTHKPKSDDSIQEKLYLLHMDLCGPMRIQSINRKKYILVIVDDYSLFTWVKFLQSNDETPEIVIKLLKKIQVRLNATVRNIRTDNVTKFVNQILKAYYEDLMFDEYFNPPSSVVSRGLLVVSPQAIDLIGTPLSTSIEQDAPAASTSSTIQETQSPVISEGVEE
ncbi:retrovirus-related pol polyprotein from transposon TNT 1-94 [Tanacetum coccineum]